MMEKAALEDIQVKFIEKVHLLTGIRLREEDLRLKAELDALTLSMGDCLLAEVPLDNETPLTDEVVLRLVFPTRTLQERLLRCKLEQLSRSMPVWSEDIRKSLREAGVNTELADSLTFTIHELGISQSPLTTPANNRNSQAAVIEMSGENDFFLSFPLRAKEILDPLDVEDLKNNLFIAILEHTLLGAGPEAPDDEEE